MNTISLHADLWHQLQEQRDRLAHALLFVGLEGIGKLELAQAFAAGVLCEQPQTDGLACGRCSACNWLAQGNHPDFRHLRPEAMEDAEEGAEKGSDKRKGGKEITIDQVRGLDDFLHVGTHREGLRVVLLHPAEAMNRNTANALLKTLEEPSPGTLFLLVSNAPERLLPTIRSRCRVVAVATPAHDAAIAWLRAHKVADPEKWLALAGGAPLRARAVAGGGQGAVLDTLLEILVAGPAISVLDAAGRIDKLVRAGEPGADLRHAVDWTQRWCADLSRVVAGLAARYFPEQNAAMAKLQPRINNIKLLRFNRKAIEFKKLSEHTLNSRLFLEDFFLEYRNIYS